MKACTSFVVTSDNKACLIDLTWRSWKKQERLNAATWSATVRWLSSRTPRSLTTRENCLSRSAKSPRVSWLYWAGDVLPTRLPPSCPHSANGIFIHVAIWPQQIRPKIGWGLCPFGGGRDGYPSNTMWPGLSPICMPSFILISPTPCDSARMSQTYRQTDRRGQTTDNGLIAYGKPFYKQSCKNPCTR